MPTDFTQKRVLGRTGLEISRMGVASGYNVPAEAVIRAMNEYGINYFYWDGRKPLMAGALRELARTRRSEMIIAIQSYDHFGFYLNRSVEQALAKLGVEYADILFLGWYNSMPRRKVLDTALRIKESGKVRFLGFTGHNRKFHGRMAKKADSPFDVQMIRYNAAHRGAESDVFVSLPENRPGIIAYTATRWGKLLNPKNVPNGEKPLTAAECYRFVLSNPLVDVCMMGPRTLSEFEEGATALWDGPLSEDEMARVQRIGDYVHG